MTYDSIPFGENFHGPDPATPMGPDEFPCPNCGHEPHACVCPGSEADFAALMRDWRERVDSGQMDVPEDGDAVFAAGFERVVAK